MKSIFLPIILFCSLCGLTIAMDGDRILSAPLTLNKPSSDLREDPSLWGDLKSVAMDVYRERVTINRELRKQLRLASIPYVSPPRQSPPPVQAKLISPGADFVTTIFADLRRALLGINFGVEQENAAIRILLVQKKDQKAIEPTRLTKDFVTIERLPVLFGDLRSVVMQVYQEQDAINTELRRQLEQASIPYDEFRHSSTFSPIQEEPLAAGGDFVTTFFANLRRTVLGIFSDVDQEIAAMRKLLNGKKQQKKDPPPITAVSTAVVVTVAVEPLTSHKKDPPPISAVPTASAVESRMPSRGTTSMRELRASGSPQKASIGDTGSPVVRSRRGSMRASSLPTIDVNDPRSPAIHRHLDPEVIARQRYDKFVRGLTIRAKIVDLDDLEGEIMAKLEEITGASFTVDNMEKALQKKLNAATSLEEAREILANGVSAPSVLHTKDRATVVEGLESDIAIKQQEIAMVMKKKKLEEGIADVLNRSGIFPGWGEALPTEEGRDLKALIGGLLTRVHNQELIIVITDVNRPFECFIPLLSGKKTIKEVQEAITEFEAEQKLWLAAKKRDTEREARAPKVVTVTELWDHFVTLVDTSWVNMEKSNAHDIMKLNCTGYESQTARFLQLMAEQHTTGLTILPFKENHAHVHINLKSRSLIKVASTASAKALKLKTSYAFETRCYKDTISPASAGKLYRLFHEENYVLWVFTTTVTGMVNHYFFAIHSDPTTSLASVVSLTLNQGNPNLTGKIVKLIGHAKELMKNSSTAGTL